MSDPWEDFFRELDNQRERERREAMKAAVHRTPEEVRALARKIISEETK